MKLNILFASITLLCAAQAAVASPIPDETFTDIEAFGLKELLEALLNIVNKMYDEIRKAAKESEGSLVKLVDNSVKVIQDSADEAMAEIQKLADEVAEQQIEEITDEVMKKCIRKLQPKIKEHTDSFYKQVRVCGDEGREKLVESTQKLTTAMEELATVGGEVIKNIRECAEQNQDDQQKAVECAAKQLQEARHIFGDKLRELRKVAVRETINVAKTVRSTRSCINRVKHTTTEKMRGIVDEINECRNAEAGLY